MTTLTQTLTLTYLKTPNLTSIQRFSLCTGLMINGDGREMSFRIIVLEEYPWGGKCWGYLGDVRGKWPDTIPEWHKRNLVTLVVCLSKLKLGHNSYSL